MRNLKLIGIRFYLLGMALLAMQMVCAQSVREVTRLDDGWKFALG